MKGLNQLAQEIFQANKEKGFWDDRLGVPVEMQISHLNPQRVTATEKAFKAQQLMLIVSELSEALEADRKDLMDDKLPHRKGVDVELVDALIRILDYAGGYNVDLETILEEKLAFNKTRPYKHGKTY